MPWLESFWGNKNGISLVHVGSFRLNPVEHHKGNLVILVVVHLLPSASELVAGLILTQTGANSPIWPFLARAKQTRVNITGGTIKSNVYGGSELGVVRDSAIVVINGENAVVNGDVYGGGFGSKNTEVMTSTIPSGSITASPLQHAGSVRGNALVKIKNISRSEERRVGKE